MPGGFARAERRLSCENGECTPLAGEAIAWSGEQRRGGDSDRAVVDPRDSRFDGCAICFFSEFIFTSVFFVFLLKSKVKVKLTKKIYITNIELKTNA